MRVAHMEFDVGRCALRVQAPLDLREEPVDAPDALLEIPRCPGDAVVKDPVAEEVQVHPLLERVGADDHPRERRRPELPRCRAVGELAPSASGAFEAAIDDETEVGEPLAAVVPDLAGARIVGRQPVEEA